MSNNARSRKYQITINNPVENGFAHDQIKTVLSKHNVKYFCMCDEKGSTYHTHLFVCFENAVHFSTVKNDFPPAHIETANGTPSENRDYIRKEGKYADTDKKETNLPDTFEENGEIPLDKKSNNASVSEQVVQMINDGFSNAEIINDFPSFFTKIQKINDYRQEIYKDKYSKENRNLIVSYIFGETGAGKTSYVLKKYGIENVYKVTNYEHPFDNYSYQNVLLLDEFRSSFPISDLLQYLDRYPCFLPARYNNKIACYKDVYIISNEDLSLQYKNIQREAPETWQALLRRINTVLYFEKNDLPFGDSNEPIITEIPLEKNGKVK